MPNPNKKPLHDYYRTTRKLRGQRAHGYCRAYVHGRRKYRHRIVAESILGRSLLTDEEVHHVDLDKENNEPHNLYVFATKSEHKLCHHNLQKLASTFIGNRIWFNWETKTYVLDRQPSRIIEKITFPNVKVYLRTDPRCGLQHWGYILKRPGRRREWARHHVCIMECMLGRSLAKGEVVHHVDLDSLNNDPNNLCLMTTKEHGYSHQTLEWCAITFLDKIIHFDRDSGEYELSG